RSAVGEAERRKIADVLDYYTAQQMDFGYQGRFEQEYNDAFAAFLGGGHADAVATGTSALYVALAALDLPKGSEVLVSPITDPGTLSAIILNGFKPRVADSKRDSYNMGVAEVLERPTPNVSAAVVVDAG